MEENHTFVGIGRNPNGPDLPLGFGFRLMQEPRAIDIYGRLSNEDKSAVIRYIQSGTSGDDAKNRIINAVEHLKENHLDVFGIVN